MGLDVTCHSVCGKQLSNETCSVFSGCRWATLAGDTSALGACSPAEAGGGESTIWVGIVLSLVAGARQGQRAPAPVRRRSSSFTRARASGASSSRAFAVSVPFGV
jgi:hypothetical protein